MTYATFFALGCAMYAGSPLAAQAGSVALFVAFMCVIVSMYGGGFATVPAYLADMFGTQYVGAIHGRLLTAWSTAGVIGPLVITQIPEYQIRSGVAARAGLPDDALHPGGLPGASGSFATCWSARWRSGGTCRTRVSTQASTAAAGGSFGIGRGGLSAPALLAWAAVGVPLAWGIWITLTKALVLFT